MGLYPQDEHIDRFASGIVGINIWHIVHYILHTASRDRTSVEPSQLSQRALFPSPISLYDDDVIIQITASSQRHSALP